MHKSSYSDSKKHETITLIIYNNTHKDFNYYGYTCSWNYNIGYLSRKLMFDVPCDREHVKAMVIPAYSFKEYYGDLVFNNDSTISLSSIQDTLNFIYISPDTNIDSSRLNEFDKDIPYFDSLLRDDTYRKEHVINIPPHA